jgi:hypothetical protein
MLLVQPADALNPYTLSQAQLVGYFTALLRVVHEVRCLPSARRGRGKAAGATPVVTVPSTSTGARLAVGAAFWWWRRGRGGNGGWVGGQAHAPCL